LIDKLDVVNGYKKDLLELYGDKITIQIYEYSFFKGYYFMKIYTSKASKLIALEAFLSKHNYDQVISFGSREYDLEIMERSDFSVCLSNADSLVKQAADLVLDTDNQEAIIRYIKKRYYQKKINRKNSN
jgi:hydroxymethylpyrimidine pyrophosphatase-like HAD family hydrolase